MVSLTEGWFLRRTTFFHQCKWLLVCWGIQVQILTFQFKVFEFYMLYKYAYVLDWLKPSYCNTILLLADLEPGDVCSMVAAFITTSIKPTPWNSVDWVIEWFDCTRSIDYFNVNVIVTCVFIVFSRWVSDVRQQGCSATDTHTNTGHCLSASLCR